MQNIYLTSENVQYLLDKGIKVGKGSDGTCILHKGKVYKLLLIYTLVIQQ